MNRTVFNLFRPLRLGLVVTALISTYPAGSDSAELLYRTGTTQSGTALVGENRNEAPSELFPCLGCHGEKAKGSREGGITAPNITWQQLTLPFRKDSKGGRARLPYDEQSFGRALNSGIDSDGQAMSFAMPRYALDQNELRNLIRYLVTIADRTEQGIEDKKIHILLRLPDNTQLAQTMGDTVRQFARTINQAGGVYRRQLVFHDENSTDLVPETFCTVDLRLLDSGTDEAGVVSLSVFAQAGVGDTAYSLYNHPSNFSELGPSLVKAHGLSPMLTIGRTADEIVQKLKILNREQVNATALIHEPGSVKEELLVKLVLANLSPMIVADATALSATSAQIIEQYSAPVVFLSPPGPRSVSPRGQRVIAQLFPTISDSDQYLAARLWSLALMKLLVSTLEESGRDLSSSVFVKTLQSHVELDTDFGPALSYSANRRIGHPGVQFIRVN